MATLSRGKIAYDLTETPYRVTYEYPDGTKICFHFSSNLYRSKFVEKSEENRRTIYESLSNRFGVSVINPILCDLRLYSSIEKRGFFVRVNEASITCLNSIELSGVNQINVN